MLWPCLPDSLTLQASRASCTVTNQTSPKPADPADPRPAALGLYDMNGVIPGVVGVVVYGVVPPVHAGGVGVVE
jgi:hypothetical protein